MLLLKIAEQEIVLPRNVGLLDTNVLVALIDERDECHLQATLVFEEYTLYEWAVSHPVVIEACGLLDSRRGRSHVWKLLQWLITPGNVRLLPGSHFGVATEVILSHRLNWMSKFVVDYVDAHLMELADALTHLFNMRPHIPIFTFDTKDFYKCAQRGCLYSLYDMREMELVAFDFS